MRPKGKNDKIMILQSSWENLIHMWFVFALVTMLAWGTADLFYKKGANETDRYSHLKTTMIVGLVMGIHAIATILFTDVNYNFYNILVYFPVSIMYIASMTIGYFGLRYLELSVSSPVQNASGAVACLLCLIFLGDTMDLITSVGVVLVCLGVVLLGVLEKKKEEAFEAQNNKKYKIGFVAFMMPILYCIIDALGTFFDAYYLDDFTKTPLVDVTEENFENVANISYELTFLACAVIIFLFLKLKKQKIGLKYQGVRAGAAIFETAGQFSYVYAMSGNGAVAAPMIASYCIVSVILSRIFLKEKLSARQYGTVAIIIAGILLIGVAEGLAE